MNIKLSSYRQKRNFKKTAEPQGRIAENSATINVSQSNIFVIQKHDASHLHYDFRLALDGVLKSWALPKGPSLQPNIKRLAVMTEDHPLEYADFAGIIPTGEYGAGTVEIWDRGTWEPISDLTCWLTKRKLEFVLHGEKMQGTWVLVGMKNNPKNWLLLKKKT